MPRSEPRLGRHRQPYTGLRAGPRLEGAISREPDPGWLGGLGALVGLVAGLIATMIGGPMLVEQAPGPCAALEVRLADAAVGNGGRSGGDQLVAAVADILAGMSHGRVAAHFSKQKYPLLPPGLGCAITYWSTVIDPRIMSPRTGPGGLRQNMER